MSWNWPEPEQPMFPAELQLYAVKNAEKRHPIGKLMVNQNNLDTEDGFTYSVTIKGQAEPCVKRVRILSNRWRSDDGTICLVKPGSITPCDEESKRGWESFLSGRTRENIGYESYRM